MTKSWWNLSPDIEERIRKRFPELVHSLHFECGDGWADLLHRTLQKIEDALEKMGKDYDSFHCAQIKEKFGELRIYLYTGTVKLYEICQTAMEESSRICEECGKPGTLRPDKWVVTRCDACYTKEKKG